MPVEVRVPAGGESIVEVLVAEWLKSEGDLVRQDEPLVTLETDKATLDLPAPAAGILTRILKPRGEVVRVGEVIAVLEEAAAGGGPTAPTAPAHVEHAREPQPTQLVARVELHRPAEQHRRHAALPATRRGYAALKQARRLDLICFDAGFSHVR